MNFNELNLSQSLLRAVEEQGYQKPSPIQEKAIPPVLQGNDLLGCAQTGTGKTAAFALPILQRLAANRPNHKGVRALILTPTRELALQIDDCFAQYGKYLTISHTVIFGGVNQNPQVAALQRGTDVLTACPGRLNDLIGQGFVDLSNLEIFVLDEADRMLDMGFVNDVKKVIRKLPAKRQNLLFSATMPKEIEQLANSILVRPVTVKVNPPSSTVDRIDQSLYMVQKGDKKRLLATLLGDPSVKNALVFSRTKHGANGIATFLNRRGIAAAAIHGNKSQSARVAALTNFKEGNLKALIATDIAARGIDISELSHVFQLDLPEVPETYVHRIGRTGRAGAEGVAVAFCSPDEVDYLRGIERLIKQKVPVKSLPEMEEMDEPASTRPERRQSAKPTQQKGTKGRQEAPKPQKAQKKTTKIIEPQPEQEVITVPENQNQPEQGLSASAKRRRRRRKASAKPANGEAKQQQATQPAAQQGQPQKPQAQQQKKQPQQPRQTQNQPAQKQGDNQRKQRGERQESNAQKRDKQQPKRQQPKQPQAKKQPAESTDPGLLLISRKPPAQKFSSFEEYMQSHGGATAPIEGGDE